MAGEGRGGLRGRSGGGFLGEGLGGRGCSGWGGYGAAQGTQGNMRKCLLELYRVIHQTD